MSQEEQRKLWKKREGCVAEQLLQVWSCSCTGSSSWSPSGAGLWLVLGFRNSSPVFLCGLRCEFGSLSLHCSHQFPAGKAESPAVLVAGFIIQAGYSTSWICFEQRAARAAEGFELCFYLDPAAPPRTSGSCSNGALNNFFQHNFSWVSRFG